MYRPCIQRYSKIIPRKTHLNSPTEKTLPHRIPDNLRRAPGIERLQEHQCLGIRQRINSLLCILAHTIYPVKELLNSHLTELAKYLIISLTLTLLPVVLQRPVPDITVQFRLIHLEQIPHQILVERSHITLDNIPVREMIVNQAAGRTCDTVLGYPYIQVIVPKSLCHSHGPWDIDRHLLNKVTLGIISIAVGTAVGNGQHMGFDAILVQRRNKSDCLLGTGQHPARLVLPAYLANLNLKAVLLIPPSAPV